jgi:mannose-6-phosphate isomerase-like protein (cupin superfamily)
MDVKDFAGARRFAAEKMQKLNLFTTERLFCDVYCLEPGQAQTPHAHGGSDKVYAVLEGRVMVEIDAERRELGAGEITLAPAGSVHGVRNESGEGAALLVFMAPRP